MIIVFILFIFVYFNIVEYSLAQVNESLKVYDNSEVAVIRIEMNPNDLQFMYDNPHSDSMHIAKVHFTNAYIDEIIDSVGIRIRGNTSRVSVKKSFKLSFNIFREKEKFYSLENINLTGMI